MDGSHPPNGRRGPWMGPERERPDVWLLKEYWPRIAGRYTPTEAARVLLKTQTMDEIRRAAMQLGLTPHQAHRERLRLFHTKYGI